MILIKSDNPYVFVVLMKNHHKIFHLFGHTQFFLRDFCVILGLFKNILYFFFYIS